MEVILHTPGTETVEAGKGNWWVCKARQWTSLRAEGWEQEGTRGDFRSAGRCLLTSARQASACSFMKVQQGVSFL